MAERSSVFSELAQTLSDRERNDLLEKMAFVQSTDDDELLPEGDVGDTVTSVDVALSRMGPFRRLLLSIRAFFTRRDIQNLVAEAILTPRQRARLTSDSPICSISETVSSAQHS